MKEKGNESQILREKIVSYFKSQPDLNSSSDIKGNTISCIKIMLSPFIMVQRKAIC